MKTINPAGDDGWIHLTNKYDAKCNNCQEDIDVGESVLWKKGEGVKHKSCKRKKSMSEKNITISDKEWKDFTKYKHDVLLKKTECQCCGKKLSGDVFINADKRVCSRHFLT